jgi:hypothetical protein
MTQVDVVNSKQCCARYDVQDLVAALQIQMSLDFTPVEGETSCNTSAGRPVAPDTAPLPSFLSTRAEGLGQS